MKIGVYSGSFDPITKGHEDIIRRAAKMTDKLVVAVLNNVNKRYLFSLEERTAMVLCSLKDLDNVEVKNFQGLLTDFMEENKIEFIIRGLRAVSDYEYELTMAFANSDISQGRVETIFMPAAKQYMYLSSSVVREIANYGGKLSDYLNEEVEKKIRDKIKIQGSR
ncbi:MAG: pantetheine-phosphate adenylyltransferase [Fusobacteriaceae bacterium]